MQIMHAMAMHSRGGTTIGKQRRLMQPLAKPKAA
jgi:hypothetical protein